MTLALQTLRNTPITEDLNDAEVGILEPLLTMADFGAEALIAIPGDTSQSGLYILVSGRIEVRLHSREGELTVHALHPGDIANTIAFVGGETDGVTATLHAIGPTRVLILDRAKLEGLIHQHAGIVYRLQRGIVRYVHSRLRYLNTELIVLNQRIAGSLPGIPMQQGSTADKGDTPSASRPALSTNVAGAETVHPRE